MALMENSLKAMNVKIIFITNVNFNDKIYKKKNLKTKTSIYLNFYHFSLKIKKIKKERKKLPWASWWCLELQLGF